VIVVSAVPVALIANVARITVTGVLSEKVGSEFAHVVFHNWGGWLMMPLALGIQWLELRLMDWVLEAPLPAREQKPLPQVVCLQVTARSMALRGKRQSRQRQKAKASGQRPR
jgi:hypothetical protein